MYIEEWAVPFPIGKKDRGVQLPCPEVVMEILAHVLKQEKEQKGKQMEKKNKTIFYFYFLVFIFHRLNHYLYRKSQGL